MAVVALLVRACSRVSASACSRYHAGLCVAVICDPQVSVCGAGGRLKKISIFLSRDLLALPACWVTLVDVRLLARWMVRCGSGCGCGCRRVLGTRDLDSLLAFARFLFSVPHCDATRRDATRR